MCMGRLSVVLGPRKEVGKIEVSRARQGDLSQSDTTIAAPRKPRYNVLSRNPACTLLSQEPRMPLAKWRKRGSGEPVLEPVIKTRSHSTQY